jgi:hypothetical protein
LHCEAWWAASLTTPGCKPHQDHSRAAATVTVSPPSNRAQPRPQHLKAMRPPVSLHRFVVDDGDYSVHLAIADKMVEWDVVREVHLTCDSSSNHWSESNPFAHRPSQSMHAAPCSHSYSHSYTADSRFCAGWMQPHLPRDASRGASQQMRPRLLLAMPTGETTNPPLPLSAFPHLANSAVFVSIHASATFCRGSSQFAASPMARARSAQTSSRGARAVSSRQSCTSWTVSRYISVSLSLSLSISLSLSLSHSHSLPLSPSPSPSLPFESCTPQPCQQIILLAPSSVSSQSSILPLFLTLLFSLWFGPD